MRIAVLARGGLSVYGGHYDARLNEAVVTVRDGETVPVTIEYASAPAALSKATSGVTATTPTASGSTASLALSSLSDGGYADVTATVGGQIHVTRIRAKSYTTTDRYDCGPEYVGA